MSKAGNNKLIYERKGREAGREKERITNMVSATEKRYVELPVSIRCSDL